MSYRAHREVFTKTDSLEAFQEYFHQDFLTVTHWFATLCEAVVETYTNVVILFLQVLNQTSRLEIQLLENSLSTNKLEKELMIQTNEISKLHDKNR